jgi:hypothetical protein
LPPQALEQLFYSYYFLRVRVPKRKNGASSVLVI